MEKIDLDKELAKLREDLSDFDFNHEDIELDFSFIDDYELDFSFMDSDDMDFSFVNDEVDEFPSY